MREREVKKMSKEGGPIISIYYPVAWMSIMMVDIKPNISLITLSVSGLSSLIKSL